jgi:hypothetical protein
LDEIDGIYNYSGLNYGTYTIFDTFWFINIDEDQNLAQKYYSMHRMSNLNKFKDSYHVFENNPRLCLMKKKSRTHLRNV